MSVVDSCENPFDVPLDIFRNIKLISRNKALSFFKKGDKIITRSYHKYNIIASEDVYIKLDDSQYYVIDGISKTYNEHGVLVKTDTYVNGKLNGTMKLYDDYGNNIEELIYENDMLVTHNYYSSQDKKLTLTRSYKDGKLKYNIHYYTNYRFDDNEKKITKQIYDDGVLVETIELNE